MFRTSPVHHQERFVQAVCADWYVVIENADSNVRNDLGYVSLHMAVLNGRLEIAKHLVDEEKGCS